MYMIDIALSFTLRVSHPGKYALRRSYPCTDLHGIKAATYDFRHPPHLNPVRPPLEI